jgi:hypothetical protein
MSTDRLPILACCLVIVTLVLPSRAADSVPLFESDVAPILAAKCGKCHSSKVQKGALDLSSIRGLLAGGESGESAVAESVDDSLLWIMIDGGDMPPEGQPPLSDKERSIIRKWLQTGAKSSVPIEAIEKKLNQHDVLPIVLLRCTTCHGARIKQGGVDLRTPASMQKGGKNGPAMIPGDPDASLMMQRIESEACPPRDLLLKFFVKRPPASEVNVLRDWIAAGAPEGNVVPDIATTEPDPLVTDEDREHWAFRPPVARSGVASIDEFILEKLKENCLGFSREATRDTLIRRTYLDLIGIPPTLSEWEEWHANDDPKWHSQLVDDLLASPRYGERWGRYWLDLAGYADSEGGTSADPVRQVAWKYRDYVIRAFNDDKPYDTFLMEQIAGDELVDHESASVITEQMVDNLIATGFLRMGMDQTGSRTMNFVPERLGVVSDAITVLSEGLMGLTMGCARCHSHKYDPIPHRDYYRFKAIFQGAFDEHDWLTFKNRKLNVDVPERRQTYASMNPPLTAKIKKLERELKSSTTALQIELLRQHYPEQSQADRDETVRALRIADNNRSQPQRILVEMLQSVYILPDSEQPASVVKARQAVRDIESQITKTRRQLAPPPTIRAVWDRGEPSPTYILRRGEHNKPGPLVGPGVPSVLTDGRTPFDVTPPFPNGTNRTGRRLAFANWLTQPEHPLTARVIVNRVWYHHFGTGLVKTLENFGTKGERPSHPELLDWLAVKFVERDWSIKDLHRLMMNSQTYRQSSRITGDRRKADPQNRLLSRMSLRRMDAEALRDSLLAVSGRLDETAGGPPDTVSVNEDGLVSVDSTDNNRWRRSIYIRYRRTEIPSMMETFDYPEMGPNCLSRSVSTASPQSLMLMNSEHVHELAASFASRVESLQKKKNDSKSASSIIDTVYQLALSRSPSDVERQVGTETLMELETVWKGNSHAALKTYCHTILNSGAFLYVD